MCPSAIARDGNGQGRIAPLVGVAWPWICWSAHIAMRYLADGAEYPMVTSTSTVRTYTLLVGGPLLRSCLLLGSCDARR